MASGGTGGALDVRPGKGLSPPRSPERRPCTRHEPSAKDLELLGLVGVPVTTPPPTRPSSASSFFGRRHLVGVHNEESRAAITAEVRSASAALLASLEGQTVAAPAEYSDPPPAVQPPAILSSRKRPASAPFPASRRTRANQWDLWGKQLPAGTMVCGTHLGPPTSLEEALALPSRPIRGLPFRAPLPSESGDISQLDTLQSVASSEAVSALPSALASAQPSAQPSALPSAQPSARPSGQPSGEPAEEASGEPSAEASGQLSRQASGQLSRQPSGPLSRQQSGQLPTQPSAHPPAQPSRQPSGQPSEQLSGQPSGQASRQISAKPSEQPGSFAPFTGNQVPLPLVRTRKGRIKGLASRHSLVQRPRASQSLLQKSQSMGSLLQPNTRIEASVGQRLHSSDASISWLSHPQGGGSEVSGRGADGASGTLEYTRTVMSTQDGTPSLSLVGQKVSHPNADPTPSGAFRQPNFNASSSSLTEDATASAEHAPTYASTWKRLSSGDRGCQQAAEKSPAGAQENSGSSRTGEIPNSAPRTDMWSSADMLAAEDEGNLEDWLTNTITSTFRAPPPTRVLHAGTANAMMPPTRLSSGPGRQIGSAALPYSLQNPPRRPPTGLRSVEDVIENRRREAMTRLAATSPSQPRCGSGALATLAAGLADLQKADEQRVLMA